MSDKNKLNHKYARKVVLTNCKNSHEVYPPAIRRVDTSVAPWSTGNDGVTAIHYSSFAYGEGS